MSHIIDEPSEPLHSASPQPGSTLENNQSDHSGWPSAEHARYEQLMAELNVMLIAEEEVEAETSAGETASGDDAEDLWLRLAH